MSAAYAVVLTRLHERTGYLPRGRDDQKAARCPAHPDASPSLSVGYKAGRVLVCCQAGCSTADVLAALELAPADLFDEPRPNGHRDRLVTGTNGPRIAATYDYTDESGVVLFQVVRYHPKDFRQRRPDGRGGWTWRLDDVRRVLYRLPEVVAAVAAGRLVWVVEGEKDADALAALPGMVATTGPAGAAKWRPEYAETLRGADVVVVADRDEAGRRHAEQVVSSLLEVAHSVEVRRARHGKDAADHLAGGGHSWDFELVAEPLPWTPPAELAAVLR